MDTNDDLRTAVMDFFKQKYDESPSRDFSKGEVAVVIHGQNITYPLDKLEAAVTFLNDAGKLLERTLPRGDVYFRLSPEAINEFSPSKYFEKPITSITINNSGIFVLGANYGQINQNTLEIFQSIQKVIETIGKLELENSKKLEVIANAETIRAQVTSPNPNSEIIQKAWGILNSGTQLAVNVYILTPLLTELGIKLVHFLH